MRELLTSGAVGNIELNAQKKIHEDIQKRWQDLGLVNGLEGHLQETVATLYENQAKHLIYEATSADNSGSFETVVFPLIRRVFSKLLANDIVSVQAMNLPIGKLFYIKPVTSERDWFEDQTGMMTGKHNGLMGYTRENRYPDSDAFRYSNRYYLPDEVVDPVNIDSSDAGNYASNPMDIDPKVTQYMRKTLYDLFYDDFLYDNSKGKIHIKMTDAVTPMVWNDNGELVECTDVAKLVDPATNTINKVIIKVDGFSSVNAGRLTGPDGNEMDTEAFLASLKVFATNSITADSDSKNATFATNEAIPFRVVTQKYGSGIVAYNDICDAKGEMYIELDLTKPVKTQGMTISGYIGIDPDSITLNSEGAIELFNAAWCEYDSLELETEMGEVSFQLTSVTVSVEERKLRATWSPELAQDVAAFHNIDAEAELTSILAEQIGAEIDREILRDIRKVAPWQARWDYNGWQRIGTASTTYTQKDWNQTLMTKINQISAQIQKSTLQGGANFIVVSAEISAVLNDLEYFHVTDAQAESEQYNMGIEKVGSLQGRYNVIVDPYAPHWSLIMGHHGTSLLNTGYIYAPYIPVALTPTMYNPFNFAPIKGIVTRYAKKVVNNRYYGAIRCDGLTYWSTNELR